MKPIKRMIIRTASRAGMVLKKHSPAIWTGVGIASMIGATIFACRGTLKAHDVIQDHKDRLDDVHEAKNLVEIGMTDEDAYTEKDYRRDLVVAYLKTGVDFLKIYGPAIVLTGLGITSILVGHNILRKRNLALTAAYTALDTAFKEYRDRVRKELGDDADYRFRTGAEHVKLTEMSADADGNVVKTKVDGLNVDQSKCVPSMYAKFFDEGSPYWQKDAGLNLAFLKSRQCEANERLLLKGHLSLNEVYDMLGLPETSYGALVGWMLKGDGDGYIDFGIFNGKQEGARRFVNGEERNILLDFNVDGIMYNKL